MEEQLEEAFAVAPHVYGNPKSYELIFELNAQFGMDVSSMRILPYVSQEIIKATNPSGTFNGRGSAYVAKTYSLKLNGQTSVHEQIIKFEKLVTRGIEFTPIPVGSPPNTVAHPALQDLCSF